MSGGRSTQGRLLCRNTIGDHSDWLTLWACSVQEEEDSKDSALLCVQGLDEDHRDWSTINCYNFLDLRLEYIFGVSYDYTGWPLACSALLELLGDVCISPSLL